MLNIVVAHTEKYLVFPHKYCQSSDVTVTFSLIHFGLIGGHKPGPVNLGVSRCSNSISVLAHCLAGRCQCHSNGTSGRSISCANIQLNIIVVCNSENLSLVRFHRHFLKLFKQLFDGTNSLKWSKNQKLTFPKVV